jgi:hypothetical protein
MYLMGSFNDEEQNVEVCNISCSGGSLMHTSLMHTSLMHSLIRASLIQTSIVSALMLVLEDAPEGDARVIRPARAPVTRKPEIDKAIDCNRLLRHKAIDCYAEASQAVSGEKATLCTPLE